MLVIPNASLIFAVSPNKTGSPIPDCTISFAASITTAFSAPTIATPTLLIGARNDPISAVPAQERLHSLFADSQLEIFDDVGHLIHYERPREAAQLIVTFLGAGTVAEAHS